MSFDIGSSSASFKLQPREVKRIVLSSLTPLTFLCLVVIGDALAPG